MHSLLEHLNISVKSREKISICHSMSGQIATTLYRIKANQYSRIYFLLHSIPTEGLLYIMAKCDNSKTKQMISHFLTSLKKVHISLNGYNLKKMGFTPGPIFKKIFQEILKARLDGLISNQGEEVAFVQERFGQISSIIKKKGRNPS